MSEHLRDLLKKAKDSADALDVPQESGDSPAPRHDPTDASRALSSQPGPPPESTAETLLNAQSQTPSTDLVGMKCPNCDRDSVVAVNRFRRVGTGIGGTLGAIVGPTAGRTAFRVLLSAAGGPAGAIVGAVLCAIAGGLAGRLLGKMIDEDMVCQFKCLKCNHKFYT